MKKNKCWVVKIGSALLTNNGEGIDKQVNLSMGGADCES